MKHLLVSDGWGAAACMRPGCEIAIQGYLVGKTQEELDKMFEYTICPGIHHDDASKMNEQERIAYLMKTGNEETKNYWKDKITPTPSRNEDR